MARAQRPQYTYKTRGSLRAAEKETYWRGIVARWKDSKLNVREFCKSERIREAQFYAWRREIGLRDREVVPATVATTAEQAAAGNPFVPLRIVGDPPQDERSQPASAEILLPGGAKISLQAGSRFDLIAKLLLEVEKEKC